MPIAYQLLVSLDIHRATVPVAAANTIIPTASLILKRAFYILLKSMTLGPIAGHR